MPGKFRINKENIYKNILPPVLFVGTVAAGVGGGITLMSIALAPEKARPRLYEHTQIPGDSGDYRISGPDQIVVKQGDFKYTFNYEAQQVIIEGDTAFTPIDFKNFSNPAMIDEIKGKGCAISASFTQAVDNYITAENPDEDRRKWAEDERAIALSFSNDYCPVVRSTPHVR